MFAACAQNATPTRETAANQTKPAASATKSGNPVFPGWYADPEAPVFGKQY